MGRLLVILVCAVCVGALSVDVRAGEQSYHGWSAEELYQGARESRRLGHLEDAMTQLELALVRDPLHVGVKQELREVQEQVRRDREHAMEQMVAQAIHDHGPQPSSVAAARERAPRAAMPLWRKTLAQRRESRPLRVPDPWRNGVQWFYVFGPDGRQTEGAKDHPAEPLIVYLELPRDTKHSLSMRVIDADTRGHKDEMSGGWNTAISFSVYGKTQLDTRVVGSHEPDGTIVEFGPFSPDQGEPQGDQLVFRVEAEGVAGDDNNLFALEVLPLITQCYTFGTSVRLPERLGADMRFYPFVPKGTTEIVESNYDLDVLGGRSWLSFDQGDGVHAEAFRTKASTSGQWATSRIAVPPGGDGTQWTYRVIKDEQCEANMSFRLTDQDGRPIPTYTKAQASGLPMAEWSGPTPASTPFGREPLGLMPDAMPAPMTPMTGTSAPCGTFTFDASRSSDANDKALAFQWDFGDGTKASGVRVTHAYQQPGDYRVILQVNDGRGGVCSASEVAQMVQVTMPPKAVLTAPSLACAGSGVRFSAAQSTDPASAALQYRWDFGDGSTGEGADAAHAYAAGGTYRVQLTVDNGHGRCATDVAMATVRVNTAPVAKAVEAVRMCALANQPFRVALAGAGTTDADGDRLTYRWDFGDGTAGEGREASHTYERSGKYLATLTVDDGSGTTCATSQTVVPVHLNRPPSAKMNPRLSGCPGLPVTLDASGSSDPDGDALTYRWDLGNGVTAEGATVQHPYQTHGQFPVTLSVDDGAGMSCSAATAQSVVEINAPPVPQMDVREVESR